MRTPSHQSPATDRGQRTSLLPGFPRLRSLLPYIRTPLLLFFSVILLGSSQQSCSRKTTLEPASALPGDATLALTVSNLSNALSQSVSLYDRLVADFPDLDKVFQDIHRMIGFNVLQPATLNDVGLNPRGGAGLAVQERVIFVVLPVSNASKLDEYLRRRLTGNINATATAREVQVGTRKGTGIFMPEAKTPGIVWTIHRGVASMAVSPDPRRGREEDDPTPALVKLLSSPEDQRLSNSARYNRMVQNLKPEGSPFLYLNMPQMASFLTEEAKARRHQPFVRGLVRYIHQMDSVGVKLDLNDQEIAIRYKALLNDEGQKTYILSSPSGKESLHLDMMVGSDATLVAKIGWRPDRILHEMRTSLGTLESAIMERALRHLNTQLGLNLEKDILQQLTGRAAFAFYRMDSAAGLGGLMSGSQSVAGLLQNLDNWSSWTYLQVVDSKKAEEQLQTAQHLLQAQGMRIQVDQEQTPPVWHSWRHGRPYLDWTLQNDLLLITSGQNQSKQAIQALKAKQSNGLKSVVTSEAAKRLLGPGEHSGFLLSINNLKRNFPILILVPAVNKPLAHLSEVVFFTDFSEEGKQLEGQFVISFTKPGKSK